MAETKSTVPRFTDAAGRVWPVEITVGTVKDLRKLLDVDLLSIIEPADTLLDRLATDAVLLCDTLFVVCRRECEARGVTDEDFGRALGGEAIEQAAGAFLEAIDCFFRNARQAALVKSLTGKTRVVKMLAALVMNAAARRLHERSSGGSSAPLESSASTPPLSA